jgi:hypothetical protein
MANLVFQIQFSDDIILIARVWTNHSGLFTAAESELKLEFQSEIETMQFIADNSTVPVPTVLEFELDSNGTVGYRYSIMTAIDGQPLGKSWTEIPSQFNHVFFDQLASYVTQLHRLSFSAIGLLRYNGHTASIVPFREGDGLFTSTSQFIQSSRQKLNVKVRQDKHFAYTDVDKEVACTVLLKMAISSVQHEIDAGPFPITHHDLHFNNILVDEGFNITAIIDWSGTSTAPQEVFASIRGFHPPPIANDGAEKFNHCRKLFVEALKGKDYGNGFVSGWVGSENAQRLELSLDRSPWRAVPIAQYLVRTFPFVFDGMDWQQLKETYGGEELTLAGDQMGLA